MKRTLLVITIVWTFSIEVFVSSHQVCFIGSVHDQRVDNQRRWFLPYENPCDCTAIRLGGMTVGDPSCLQVAPYYLKGLILSEDPQEIRDFLDCPVPSPAAQGRVCSGNRSLGLGDGTIPDDRITASSSLDSFAASNGRLDYDGFWRPLNNDPGSWIEVDLTNSALVYGVTTQGSANNSHFRVTRYRVAYQKPSSPDDSPLEYVRNDEGNIELFAGNVDDADVKITNLFAERILATRVRIEPEMWSNKIALRFELLGCFLDP